MLLHHPLVKVHGGTGAGGGGLQQQRRQYNNEEEAGPDVAPDALYLCLPPQQGEAAGTALKVHPAQVQRTQQGSLQGGGVPAAGREDDGQGCYMGRMGAGQKEEGAVK